VFEIVEKRAQPRRNSEAGMRRKVAEEVVEGDLLIRAVLLEVSRHHSEFVEIG